VRGTVGTRYEYTENEIVALNCKNCASALSASPGRGQPLADHQTTTRNYDYWLPSAILAADLRDDLVLRRGLFDLCPPAAARQRADHLRPGPTDLTPPVDPIYTVTLGATDIKPYTSDSFDVAGMVQPPGRPGLAGGLPQEDRRLYRPDHRPVDAVPGQRQIPGLDVAWAR
jgi:outer membrane receptor protein involved in Fe transport